MSKEAENLYFKLNQNEKRRIRKSLVRCYIDFAEYVKSLLVTFDYDSDRLEEVIFDPKWLHNRQGEYVEYYCYIHLKAASQTLERLKEVLRQENKFNYTNLNKRRYFIQRLISQLKEFIKTLDNE